MVLKLSARICCTAGIEHRQRPAVEKAHNRSKAIALVMGVVRLSFLITVKINMRGVDINDQYRSLPGPGPRETISATGSRPVIMVATNRPLVICTLRPNPSVVAV